MKNEVKAALVKRDNFTIPEVQQETGMDYGNIKKCVDELVGERIFARGEGLNYFKLREPSPPLKRRPRDDLRSLLSCDDDDDDDDDLDEYSTDVNEDAHPYAYAGMPSTVFQAHAKQQLAPLGFMDGDKLKVAFAGVLPDAKMLTVTIEIIDGKYRFTDGGQAFAAATASGRSLSFRFFANRLNERANGEFGRVKLLNDKQMAVPIMDLDYCTFYLMQLVAAIRSFFGEKP